MKQRKIILVILSLFAVFSMAIAFSSSNNVAFADDIPAIDLPNAIDPPSVDPNSPNYGGDVGGDTKTNLTNWQDELTVANPITSIFRGFGWWLIIQTGAIVNGISNASQYVYGLLGLYGSDTNVGPLQQAMNDYMPIFVAIGVLVFVAMMVGVLLSKNQDIVVILKSLLLGASILVILPFSIGKLSTISSNFGGLITTTNNTGYAVIDQNVIDLYAVDKNYGWIKPTNETVETKEKTQNFLDSVNKQSLQTMDINAPLETDTMTSDGKEVANNMLTTDASGKSKVVSLNEGTGKSWFVSLVTGDSAYYRYHVNFFKILFYNLLVLIIAGFLLYKLVKIEIEIVMNSAILQATALTDTKGKRNWEFISKIVASFGALVMVSFLQVVFSKGYAVTSNLGGGVVVQVIAGIALAFAIIEGPNIFQSAFGVSASLDGGLKDMMTASQSMMLMRSGARSAMNVGQTALNAGASTAGGIAGIASGLTSKNGKGDGEESGGDNGLANSMINEGDGLNGTNGDDVGDNINGDSLNNNSENMNQENMDELNNSELNSSDSEANLNESQNVEGMTSELGESNPELNNISSPIDSNDNFSDNQRADSNDNKVSDGLSSPESPVMKDNNSRSDMSPNLGQASQETPNLGAVSADNRPSGTGSGTNGSQVNQGLGGTMRNMATGKFNSIKSSPKPNPVNRFTSSYRATNNLTNASKNSLNNSLDRMKNLGSFNTNERKE